MTATALKRALKGQCKRCGRRWAAPDAETLAAIREAHVRAAPGQPSDCDRVLHSPVGICPAKALRCERCGRISPRGTRSCDGCGMVL
ncbi:MAG: hypothetical protein OXE43_07475 [Chloroflexi bacterium]|nr:hypothetical protein [Chloroflexota bacterium]